MSWNSSHGPWWAELIPQRECDFYHLLSGLTGSDAPTGQWGIVMACIIRYAGLKRVVELGMWEGGTTVCLAAAVRDTGGACFAVDMNDCSRARQRLEMLRLGPPHCYFIQGKTTEVHYDGDPIDLLFIDADHSYEGVKADWERWGGMVKKGGWIFMDNASTEKGVMQFLDELLNNPETHLNWQYVICPESYGMGIFRRLK